jgi:hypothetical protein
VPAWSFDYLPSQDGPAHVGNANILLNAARPDLAPLRYYAINPRVPPNLLTHGLMAGLLSVAPPAVVVKLVASLYLVVFPLSVFYAARGARSSSARRGALVAAALAVPLATHLLFAKGFYNFCFGTAAFLVTVGFYLRQRGHRPTVRTAAVTAGLVAALYLCHPVALLMSGITVGALAAWSAAVRRVRRGAREGAPARILAARRRAVLLPLLGLVPAAMLATLSLAREAHAATFRYSPFGVRVKYLATLNVLRSYGDAPERIAARLLAVTLVVAVTWALVIAWRRRTLGRQGGLLAAMAVSLLVYFAAPDATLGGSYVTLRLSLFPVLLILLWLARQPIGRPAGRAVVAVAACCTVLLAVSQWRVCRASAPLLRDFCSAAAYVKPGATLLPLIDDARAPSAAATPAGKQPRVLLFHNAAGYLAAMRDAVDLRNYQASLGYFPTLYRPELDPTRYLAADPPDVAGYLNATGGRATVDYLLVCPADRGDAVLESLAPAVRAKYRPAYHSPAGAVALYARTTP